MAQARKNRKQWRPKAVIESSAAQHRTNADHLITSYYQERQSTINPTSIVPEKTSITLPIDLTETLPINTVLDSERNSLMLKLSTPVLRPSTTITSSSGDQIDDDDECDNIDLFVQQEQPNGNKKNEHETQIEILLPTNKTSNIIHFKTTNRGSQTDTDGRCHYPAKRVKTRLKNKNNSNNIVKATTTTTSPNNVKVAKRKAYSRMKKERKATQTLIIVLSKFKII
jgi:hypothetical protein